MYAGFLEEGDRCKENGCNGVLEWGEVEGCSCHIHPPCSACVNNVLVCPKCGWEDEPPAYKDIEVAPGLAMREYRPKQLDKTKIDYRNKMHTHFSMIKEGVYPEGTTRGEVEAVVKGTFGGRFKQFGRGKFEYVAYTD
jgi:hypothetical protein